MLTLVRGKRFKALQNGIEKFNAKQRGLTGKYGQFSWLDLIISWFHGHLLSYNVWNYL